MTDALERRVQKSHGFQVQSSFYDKHLGGNKKGLKCPDWKYRGKVGVFFLDEQREREEKLQGPSGGQRVTELRCQAGLGC